MSSFTLDDIRAAAEAKYASTDIDLGNGEVVVLLNPLRLSKAKRKELTEIQEALGEDDADHEELLDQMFRVVGKDSKVERLVEVTAGDLPLKMQVLHSYTEKDQAGEASPSQD